jgi:hypothetical protein
MWVGWRSALGIVQPETLIAWHRLPFLLDLEGPPRPTISQETRVLIRKLIRREPSLGTPRIHGQ